MPFPIESLLSGVARRLEPDERLWYWRSFEVPDAWWDDRILLHFGGVDWEAMVCWRFTTGAPGEVWQRESFDDSRWSEGPAGFGTAGTPGAVVRTSWDTSDVWLRRRFALERAPAGELALWIHHDEDAEVFLNGAPIAALSGYRTGYCLVRLDAAARESLREGENFLAVRCRQSRGGQYVDVGLVEIVERTR